MKKRFFSILIPLMLAGLIFTGCPGVNSDPELAAVKNFSKYTGIGVASTGSSRAVTGNARAVTSSNYTLVGELADGSFESITFTTTDTDDEGNPVEVNYGVTAFNSTDNLIFFCITDGSAGELDNFKGTSSGSDTTYIIDKRDGNIYSFDHYVNLGINSYTYNDIDGTIYVGVCGANDIESIYRLSIANSQLTATKLLNTSAIDDYQVLVTDKYNNLYVFYGSDCKSCYLINSENELTRITDKNFFLSLNKTMYEFTGYSDLAFNGYFDDTGSFIESNETPDGHFLFRSASTLIFTNCLVKTTDTDYYYYYPFFDTSRYDDANTIYKADIDSADCTYITFTGMAENEETTAMKYYNSGSLDFYGHTADNLYFLNDSEIFSVDIETGTKTSYSFDYYINTITTDSTGKIYFTGLSKDLEEVSGTIDNEGNITTELESVYTIYYFSSL